MVFDEKPLKLLVIGDSMRSREYAIRRVARREINAFDIADEIKMKASLSDDRLHDRVSRDIEPSSDIA